LLEEVRSSGARVTLDARVSRVTFKHAAQGWTVQFKHAGTSLECNSRYIVDAGGSAARIARALGAGFVGDDDLYAVVARYPGESPCQTSLLLEPSPIGWWYATALKRESTVVLVTDLAGMRQWMPADRNNWTTLLAATRYVNEGLFGETPSGITARYIPSRRTLPVCGERWIAVGDAAMSADPLSTLGIAFALSSGIGAAHAIVSELNGDNSAREYYGTRAASIFDGYRWSRERFYGAEKRWADEPFWETRRNRYVSGTV
jgi:flavin-dependent dehydrogenase